MTSRSTAFALGLLLSACADNGTGSRSDNEAAGRGSEPKLTTDNPADGLPRVEATIDLSKPSTIAQQAEALADKLDRERIYLDLTIIPEGQDEGELDYRVTETPQNGESRPLSCSFGKRFDSKTFAVSFNPEYNHLLVEILHGPPHALPYATAACVYAESSVIPRFNLRGYYAVSRIGIPTANDVQLRPIAPPVD